MPFAIEPMRVEDIPEVVEIEKACFTMPWPASAYKREIKNLKSTRYLIARYYPTLPSLPPTQPDKKNSLLSNFRQFLFKEDEPEYPTGQNPNPVVGYGGLWMMMDEAHITTLGVSPEYRGKSVGELLLVGLTDVAMQLGASWLTLEVRVSNTVAQNLYKKYTFQEKGLRRKYYTDNNEDAYIMWSEELTTPAFRQKYAELKQQLYAKLRSQNELSPNLDPAQPIVTSQPDEAQTLPPPPPLTES